MKRKKKATARKRRPYRPPEVVSEPIFERYALMCSTKDRRRRGFMT